MYEGVNNNLGDENQEQPFDYLAEAQRLREQRELKDATEKAEKTAKEQQKREERIAKQLARSVAKREEIADRSKGLETSAQEAKDQVRDVKQEVKDIQKEVGSLPKPVDSQAEEVVYKGTAGSEVTTMGLENGEGATIELQHDIGELDGSLKRTEETIALADEVTARAEAIASERDSALDRARSAVRSLEANDIATHSESGSVPYDLSTEQQELRDRIQHTWEGVLPPQVVEQAIETTRANVDTSEMPPVELTSYNPVYTDGSTQPSPVLDTVGYSQSQGTIEKTPDHTSPITSSVKSGVAFVGGLLAGRSRVNYLKRSVEKTNVLLSDHTREIKRDVDAIQSKSVAHEYVIPKQMEVPLSATATMRPESTVVSSPEIHGTDAPAIPAWIKQVESDIKKGKVIELKKWQQDVLRIQHPALMKQYEKLDSRAKEVIRSQSKETLSAQFIAPSTAPQALNMPGELPVLASSLPAYMNPVQQRAVRPTFDYTSLPAQQSTTLSPGINTYLTTVLVGGILFGAVLIFAFGM